MSRFRTLLAVGAFALTLGACADLDVTNLNNPDRERAISTPADVEGLISGSFIQVWAAMHHFYPGPALQVAADSHSSSWGNFGMRDAGNEPRLAFDNSPSYAYNEVAEVPWGRFYSALSAVRDGLVAIDGGIQIGPNGRDNPRAIAFGKFVQGLALSYLGIIYDKAFFVDETVSDEELSEPSFTPYDEIHAAGIAKLDEAIQLAQGGSFTIPALWLGFDQEWSAAEFARLASSLKARLMTQVPRSPAEAQALNWGAIQSAAENGLTESEGFYTDDDGTAWAWHADKLYAGTLAGWARTDIRTVGPADSQGRYQAWLAAAPQDRSEFNIDTDDRRITGGDPEGVTDGTFIRNMGGSPFPAARGRYHYSNYRDFRYDYYANPFVGRVPDWIPAERDFLIAEAELRSGDPNVAMGIINQYRTAANLPPFTDPSGVAPGGERCVPKTASGACGDLVEALKHEKRLELYHTGAYTEYTDDRRWGDLVSGTYLQLPVPGSELLVLLQEIYTFGGGGEGSAPNLVNDFSPEGLRLKRQAIDRLNEAVAVAPRKQIVAH